MPIAQVSAALQALSDRCLYKSHAWLAEYYAVLVDQCSESSDIASPPPAVSGSSRRRMNLKEESLLLQARSLFPLHEYLRAADILRHSTSNAGYFLRYYATYLNILECARTSAVRGAPDVAIDTAPPDSEIAQQLNYNHSGDSAAGNGVGGGNGNHAGAHNNNNHAGDACCSSKKDARLRALRRDIAATIGEMAENDDEYYEDGYLLYLQGAVARRLGLDDEARTCLLRAVTLECWNWGAWIELARVTRSTGDARTYAETAEAGLMGSLYIAHVCNENDGFYTARKIYERLVLSPGNNNNSGGGSNSNNNSNSNSGMYPGWGWARAQLALVLYNMREFDAAEVIYGEMLFPSSGNNNNKADEHRLEGADIYSNILFVKEDKAKLSQLAHRCNAINRIAMETCVVTGNYMSLRQSHEAAVVYFRRALKLNPSYLSAWTLMGHEYVELKNAAAAIQAYRKAVDINANDFRAWYGLGQTYELMQMPAFTLYYFRKAAQLRPNDPRMWCAVGHTYEELDRKIDAARCYHRALRCDPNDSVAHAKLEGLQD